MIVQMFDMILSTLKIVACFGLFLRDFYFHSCPWLHKTYKRSNNENLQLCESLIGSCFMSPYIFSV